MYLNRLTRAVEHRPATRSDILVNNPRLKLLDAISIGCGSLTCVVKSKGLFRSFTSRYELASRAYA